MDTGRTNDKLYSDSQVCERSVLATELFKGQLYTEAYIPECVPVCLSFNT